MRPEQHISHKEHLISFQRGEEKGFNFLFREFYAPLTYFSFKITSNHEAAEEIAGEALLKLWERHTDFDNILSIKSFLYTTTRNKSLNFLRQQKADSKRNREITLLTQTTDTHILQQITEAEFYRAVITALETLPPQCRQVFQLLFVEGKDHQEVATEMNLSPSTIRNQKARGLKLLKQRLEFCMMPVLALLLSF